MTEPTIPSGSTSDRVRAAAEAAAALLPPNLAADGIVDLLVRSAYDGELRSQLVSDPVAAAAAAGVELDLPDGARIDVHERTATVVHLVLPGVISDVPDPASTGELTDDQIQTDSGRRILVGDAWNWGDPKPKNRGDQKGDGATNDYTDYNNRGNADLDKTVSNNDRHDE